MFPCREKPIQASCHVCRGRTQAAQRTHCAHATMHLDYIIGYDRMLVYLGQLHAAP